MGRGKALSEVEIAEVWLLRDEFQWSTRKIAKYQTVRNQ